LFTAAKTTIVRQVTSVNPPLGRRERVRAATQSELTAAARELLRSGGTEAVTVRSIAGRLGMTAPAIYRYFDGREALLNALVDELYDELADYLYASRASHADGTLADRFYGQARAFRTWALDHLPEFGLLFGAPIPGVGKEHLVEEGRGHRFGLVWLELFIELASLDLPTPRWSRPIPPSLRRQLDAYLARIGQAVDIDIALLYLSCWERLYGAVCTEAFGHLHFALEDGEELFEDHLADCGRRLGIAPE
jgi:AcrR family transcriptional regulator